MRKMAAAAAAAAAPIGRNMEPRAATLVLALLIFGDVRSAEWGAGQQAARLDALLAEYERAQPPAAGVLVLAELDVRHASVCDDTASMRLLADLKMSWTDARLSWNVSEGESVLVSAERVWSPDVRAEAAGGRAAGGEVLARVGAGGTVTRVLRLDLSAPLRPQLEDWPLDTQRGFFRFSSRDHDIDEIDIRIVEYKGSVVVETGSWEVVSVTGSRRERVPAEGAGPRRVVQWTVAARRRGGALAAQHGAVLAAAALLLAAALARPYPRRAPLAAAATLVSALWLISAMSVVPGGGAAPRVVRVMHAMCVLSASCGVAGALAQRVARATAAPPRALRALLTKVSYVRPHAATPEGLSESSSGAWVAAAALLDAVLALLVALALLVLVAVYVLA